MRPAVKLLPNGRECLELKSIERLRPPFSARFLGEGTVNLGPQKAEKKGRGVVFVLVYFSF